MQEHPRLTITMDGRLCFLLALLLLLLPLPWVLAAIFAACVHELCHAVAILLQNGQIYALHLTAGGIRMQATPLRPGGELLASLAGPFGSAALALFAPILPRAGFCGAVHCLFNLLPLFPLDGGRVLQNLLLLCMPAYKADRLFGKTQGFIRVLLALLCVAASLRWGMMLAVVGLLMILRQWRSRTV